MSKSTNSVNDRLEQSSQGGSPKLNPDEQRRYLGTFRERVVIAVPFKDLSNPKAQQVVKEKISGLTNKSDFVLLLNGNLGMDTVMPYIKIANDANIEFTTLTDKFYWTKPDSFAVVLASRDTALNNQPIIWSALIPHSSHTKSNSESKPKSSHRSLLTDLKHFF